MNGYIRFAGIEVINTERLQTYVANGIAPKDGTRITVEDVCEGISGVLYPSGDFTTPLQDEPPWYDANDPDTWDFAGILPIEVTGLDDTTRTVQMTQTLKGNGLAGRAIRGPQTVGVTGVLVGRTTEGVKAGLSWLRRVLHGSCDADEQPCGQSGTLETFSACPGPIVGGVDPDKSITDVLYHPFKEGGGIETGPWLVLNGTFDDGLDTLGTYLVPNPDGDIISAGDADDYVPDYISGGGAEPANDVISGGSASSLRDVTLGGTRYGCTAGTVTITWRLQEWIGDQDPNVRMVLLDDANVPVEMGPTPTLVDAFQDYTWTLPLGVDLDGWRPAIISDKTILVYSVSVTYQDVLDPLDCIAPYRRFFPVTATTSGPTPVDIVATACAELLIVEWTWESGSPYRFGVREQVLLGMGWGVPPSLVAPGVSYDEGDGSTLTPAGPWNCAPPGPVASCAIDPLAPTLGVPPAYPVIVDTSRPRITTQNVRDMWAVVGPELIPSNEGVFTIDLIAGSKPVVGVRIRVWDDADADGTVPDLCDFAYEFLIDYIPKNGVLTIDGAAGTITTLCEGNTVPQDASAGVRGAFGGPIEDPVVRCDRRYLVRAQWLDTYPNTAPGYYTAGDSNGAMTMSLSVTDREG